MLKELKKELILFFVFLVISIFLMVNLAYAGLGVSPCKLEFSVSSGEVYTQDITVRNISGEAVHIVSSIMDSREETDGSPNFMKSGSYQYGAAKWIKIDPAEADIPANSSIKFKMSFAPSEDQVGGRYGAILFKAVPKVTETTKGKGLKVVTLAQVATLILAKIEGSTEKKGIIERLTILQDKPGSSIKFNILFKNQGNIHFSPGGNITIKDINNKVIDKILITPGTILPDCSRWINAIYQLKEMQVGTYKAEIEVTLEKAKLLNKKVSFSIIRPGELAQPKAEIFDFPEIKVVQRRPINFNFLFTNAGNVKLNPKINLEIKDFEDNLITTIPIVSKEINIGSSEEFKGIWEKGLSVGNYQAIVNAEYSKPEFGGIKKTAATAKIAVIEKELVLKGEISKFMVDSIKSGEAVVPQLFFKNTGNTEFSVEGLIELKNSAGKTVGQIPVNKIELAEKEEKRLGMNWSGTLPVGLYKAVVTLIYGGGKMASGEASFLVK